MFVRRNLVRKVIQKTHMLTKGKPYECETCKKKFLQKSSLNTHIIIHTVDRPFGCDGCYRRLSDSSARNRHLRTYPQQH